MLLFNIYDLFIYTKNLLNIILELNEKNSQLIKIILYFKT